MSSILLPILVASFIGYQLDELKAKKYEMSDSKGEVVKVQFSQKGEYACPLSCSLEHYHYATLSDDNSDIVESDSGLWAVEFDLDNSGFNTYHVNGLAMESYMVLERSKKMPKQSVPFMLDRND